MNLKPLIVAATLAAVAAAPATAQAMTTSQAKRAVQREIRFEIPRSFTPDVTCRRLSSSMFNCRWFTLTDDDVQAGDVDGHTGVGYVRGRSVRIVTLDCGTCS